MAIKDRNGLHGEKDGKFVSKYKTESKAYDSRDNFSELKKRVNKSKKTPRLDSAVMNKYSTVRKKVERKGFATIYVNDGSKSYYVRINKSNDDFEYDVMTEGEDNE